MTETAPAGAARYVGSRVSRVEDARLLTGHGTFVDDVMLPGMLHACFVRSPYPRAAIRGIDTAAARAHPGVAFVFTAADLNPGVKEQWHTSIGAAGPDTPRPPLAEGEVRFVGDPVVLVVAASRAIAEDAADLVDIDYEPRPAVIDYEVAEHAEDLVHEAHGSNVAGGLAGLPRSALEDVLASAAHVATETIRQQAYAPVPMEGRGLIVDCSPVTGELTMYAATQAPHEWRLFCSRLLGRARAPDPRGHARHRWRVRPEGDGPARRDVPDARRTEGRRTAEVGRGPAREPARGRTIPARARHGDDGVRRGRRHPGRAHRLRRRLRRVPHSVAGHARGGRRCALPRPVPCASRRVRREDRLHEHRRVGRRTAARGSSSRWHAR